jgi:hypothetical protein
MSFNVLQKEMLEMIKLSGEIAQCNQMFLHRSNVMDKGNFNPKMCEELKNTVKSKQDRFNELKNKWFN